MENVTEQRVHSETAVLALLSRGSNARTKAETQVNVPARVYIQHVYGAAGVFLRFSMRTFLSFN